MTKARFQTLRSEVGRKGQRVLATVNIKDLQLGLLQVAPVNRDAWLAEVSRRIMGAVASGDPSWQDADYRESVVKAALWLFDEREAIHGLLGGMGWKGSGVPARQVGMKGDREVILH